MVPSMPEKSEWRLNGQMLTYTMALSESITSLKSKIQDDVGMQPAKQKLYYDVIIITFFILVSLYDLLIKHIYFFRECSSKIQILWRIIIFYRASFFNCKLKREEEERSEFLLEILLIVILLK